MAEWYDNQNMGSAFPLLDYGVNKLANYASNALSNNQNNYSDAEKTGIGKIFGSLKNKLGNIPFPSIAHLINKTTRPGADLSFAGYPDGTASRGGLYANEVANMQKLADMGRLTSGGKDRISGKNVVSGFGDYNKGMEKSLDRFEQTAKDKGYGEDENSLDKLAAYYKSNKLNATLQRLKHAQQMTGDKSWQGHQDDNNNFITRTPPGGQQGIGEGFEDIAPTGGSTVSHDYTDDISFDESPAADSGGWGDDYASEMIAEGGRVGLRYGGLLSIL